MCCSKGLLKRFVPFLLTLAAGLLIASFFVPILPNLSFNRGPNRRARFEQMERENKRLSEENYNLKLQLEQMRKDLVEGERNWYGSNEKIPLIQEIPAPPVPRKPIMQKRGK